MSTCDPASPTEEMIPVVNAVTINGWASIPASTGGRDLVSDETKRNCLAATPPAVLAHAISWHKPTSHTRAHAEQKTQHHQGAHHSRLLYHAANLPISEPALCGAGLPVDMAARRARLNRPSCVRAGAPAIRARPHPLATAAMCAAVLLLLRAPAATAALHMRCIRKRQRRTCTRQGCVVCGAHQLWWSCGQEGARSNHTSSSSPALNSTVRSQLLTQKATCLHAADRPHTDADSAAQHPRVACLCA